MKYILAASFALVGEATNEIYRQRAPLLNALLIPSIGIFLVHTLSSELSSSPVTRVFLALAGIPLWVIFATTCHRVVLLGEKSLPHRWGLFWTERETRFLGWLIGVWFLYFGLSIPIGIILALFSKEFVGWHTTWVVPFSIYFIVAYFEGRFSLVLPATAIDKRSDFKESWAMSRGKGMLIAIALLIPALILIPIEVLLYDAVSDKLTRVVDLIWLLIALPIFAIEIAVVSLAYDKLASQDWR